MLSPLSGGLPLSCGLFELGGESYRDGGAGFCINDFGEVAVVIGGLPFSSDCFPRGFFVHAFGAEVLLEGDFETGPNLKICRHSLIRGDLSTVLTDWGTIFVATVYSSQCLIQNKILA